MHDSNPEETYLYAVQQLEKKGLGMLHIVEPSQLPEDVAPLAPRFRKIFTGLLVLNFGYTKATAETVISDGVADAVSFASLFIANPDLPVRFAEDSPLAAPGPATFYGGDAKGYTDYPILEHA